MKRLKGFLIDNGLSLALLGLFLICLVAQSLSGSKLFNDNQASLGRPLETYPAYLLSGDFLEGVFSNWQAAVLQLASLVLVGVFTHQKGAPHSKDPASSGSKKEKPKSGHRGWLHDNSLSVALWTFFFVAFIAHFLSGHAAYNSERDLSHQPPIGLLDYATSAKFWFQTFQTWQAEYFAIALYVILSIFLRQKGSPESKPADASDEETGKADT